MHNSYIIEIGEDPVGLVVKENDQFHFVASHRDVWSLDGVAYPSPNAARQAASHALRQAQQRRNTRYQPALAG